MRRVLLLSGLMFLLAAGGCEKTSAKKDAPAKDETQAHGPTGVVVNPGLGGGGSGGAAQAIRKAVVRTVNQNELKNLHLYMETASVTEGKLPNAQQITSVMQREAPATFKLLQEKAIILTGATTRESVWAYTADPQNHAEEHFALTAQGIERMSAQQLRDRLR